MQGLSAATKVPPGPPPILSPPLSIASGTLEAIKWIALVLMTVDHVNKYLFDHAIPALYALGRIAMPLFVFVLAYNLARPGALERGVYARTASRLALYGALACIPFIALGKVVGGWWPLNMMVSLLVATIVIGLIERGRQVHTTMALVVFVLAGALVEYWWWTLVLAIACWRYSKRPNFVRLTGVIGALALLWPVNQNPWAFAALPLMVLAPRVTVPMTRAPRFFYIYYPAHLGILLMLFRWLH